MSDERFTAFYDRVVRRLWASPTTPLDVLEVAKAAEDEGLAFPWPQGWSKARAIAETDPHTLQRLGSWVWTEKWPVEGSEGK